VTLLKHLLLVLSFAPQIVVAQGSYDPKFENVEVRRLGSEINSPDHEQVDAVSPDGTMLFISRTPNGGRSDVYVASQNTGRIRMSDHPGDQGWSRAELLHDEINDSSNNFIGGITTNGDMIAVGREGQIAISRKFNGVWQTPDLVRIDSFYTYADFLSFALSPDGRSLVMALERDDSFGETDLYLSRLRPDSTWTVPLRLGKEINSKHVESGPTFSPHGSTLYFSSNRPRGFGGYDLYSVQFKTSDLDGRSSLVMPEAVNLGPKLNSQSNEQFLVTGPDSLRAYFTSDRIGGAGRDDIYEVILSPQETGLTITGTVRDEVTREPIAASIEIDLLPSRINIAVDSSDDEGFYSFQLPYLAKYEMRITGTDYLPAVELVAISKVSTKRVIERDLYLSPLKPGVPIELKGIYFETGSATLTESSRPALDAVMKLLVKRPNMRVAITGHTDNVGDAEKNRELSLARAQAVVAYLVEQGIHSDRMVSIGFGETKPRASNKTEKGRQQNRRVEFTIQ
jgi:OmpA-OmpF porin, OOP family